METTQSEQPTGSVPEEKATHKISDDEFLEALRFNYGVYAQTARYIEHKYDISYSRSAVCQRAQKFLNEVFHYRKEATDLAETTIYETMSQKEDIKLRYQASVFLLTHFNEY